MKKQFQWDRVVRATHLLVAIGCILNFFFTPKGSLLHQLIGYGVLLFVVLRLIWSVSAAPSPARLRDMLPTISGMRQHLRALKARDKALDDSCGHNSFGLLFIWAAWGLIIAIASTGYLAALGNTDPAPLIAGTENWALFAILHNVAYWHGLLVTVLEWLVVAHVVAVIATSWWLKDNYLAKMFGKCHTKSR